MTPPLTLQRKFSYTVNEKGGEGTIKHPHPSHTLLTPLITVTPPLTIQRTGKGGKGTIKHPHTLLHLADTPADNDTPTAECYTGGNCLTHGVEEKKRR